MEEEILLLTPTRSEMSLLIETLTRGIESGGEVITMTQLIDLRQKLVNAWNEKWEVVDEFQ